MKTLSKILRTVLLTVFIVMLFSVYTFAEEAVEPLLDTQWARNVEL